MRSLGLVLPLAFALALSAASAASPGSTGSGAIPEPAVVASLEPEKTETLWSSLVRRQMRARQAAPTDDCRPMRLVFYAATDWLRLATTLAANASPCAEYYISIPAIVGNRTQMRRDAAWRIRALGPNFHPMAEFHFSTWSRFVAESGISWYQAGVLWRQRMDEAGFDVAAGDTWVVNELSTAVRLGSGNARANIRELLRGLYEGDGTRPTRGAVLVVGVGQRTGNLSVYQNTLQTWLEDTEFWTDVARYVADWAQEAYGDIRAHAVPGASIPARRELLNDYLQHALVLANAGPESVAVARAYLRDAHTPLGNAAWERSEGYGWTMVPAEQMAAYVSAQVHAMRHFGATSGAERDRGGFAWAPRNASGLSAEQFAEQTGLILDRLASAIRDSGERLDPNEPGIAACGPPGIDALCALDLEGARFNEAWRSFRTWTAASLALAAPPRRLPAGEPSPPLELSLVTSSGTPVASKTPVAVTLRTSSPQGAFATSPDGPWTRTLSLTVAGGANAVFYYRDTRAGEHTLTATSSATRPGSQTVRIAPGPVVAVTIEPASVTIRANGATQFEASAVDAFGNDVPTIFLWRVAPARLGRIGRSPDGTATLAVGRLLGSGTVTATAPGGAGPISASARIAVTPADLRLSPVAFREGGTRLRVVVRALDEARKPVSRARVAVLVKRDGKRHALVRATTGPAGKAIALVPAATGCFTVEVTRARAQGFRWDGRTPRNRFCRR
ncbi:MAG: hypothetical protein KatS3mg012_1949 [Gaiellaceae bacterium]|nr:MAG: hypothetical protein KatS3mg012_1949 [Gaiellaceae bacterium]